MATQSSDEVVEWHKRLGGDNYDYWISPTVSACFTEEKLKALSDIYSTGNFSNLSECLKTKLLLALCNIPQRNSDQWRQHIDAVFNVALSEGSDSWVRPMADMLHTLPSLGYLRTTIDDNPLFSDALIAVQTKRPWRLNALPMEAEFVNPDVLADLGCPDHSSGPQQQKRHFLIVRKPRSVVAMGAIMEKAKQRDDSLGGGGGGRRFTAPIKMRSFAKNWFDDEDEDDHPTDSASSLASRRPPPTPHASSLTSSSRLPGSQTRRPQLGSSSSSSGQPSLQLLGRQRSVNPHPSTPGGGGGVGAHALQQQRTTKLIELSEPPAIGRAAKARRRQDVERRRQEERAAKRQLEEEAARAKAREVEEAGERQLAKQAEEEEAAAAAAASSAAAAAVAAPASAADTTAAAAAPGQIGGVPVSMATATIAQGLPPQQPQQSLQQPTLTAMQTTTSLPSLRLTPAVPQPNQQLQQPHLGASAGSAPTPSYLLPFAPAYAGQLQQPALFAYSQPATSAPGNITVLQLIPNRAYTVAPQQQAAALAAPLTPEQSRAAAELFATANKLTKPEKSVILAFIGGNRTNLSPDLGNLVRIHLSEYKERVFDQNQRVYKDVVADQYFQMDYATGHWTIVKRYKEGTPDVLAKLDYLRPPVQQPQQPAQMGGL